MRTARRPEVERDNRTRLACGARRALMGIAITDDHRELAEVARGFLTSQKARWAARSLLDASDEPRPGFWQHLVELGWLGLHVDEEYGGSGFGLPELVVVIEELGRAVAPGPFVPTVIASAVIAKDGTPEQKSRLLAGLIDGTVTAGIGLDSQVHVADGVADGEAGIVLGAGLAELLLIAAGDDVLVLERGRAGVRSEEHTSELQSQFHLVCRLLLEKKK